MPKEFRFRFPSAACGATGMVAPSAVRNSSCGAGVAASEKSTSSATNVSDESGSACGVQPNSDALAGVVAPTFVFGFEFS